MDPSRTSGARSRLCVRLGPNANQPENRQDPARHRREADEDGAREHEGLSEGGRVIARQRREMHGLHYEQRVFRRSEQGLSPVLQKRSAGARLLRGRLVAEEVRRRDRRDRRRRRMKKTTALRRLLKKKDFVYMPVAYDALGGRLLQSLGFECAYTGGFVTGASRCTSEPLLTMDEQLRVAGDVAAAIDIPLVVDGGAGFGEPLHTMRTVRECIRAGIAGAHIEDQLYPKRAHYHKYVAHAVPRKEFAAKIAFACRQRDRSDKDFVVIARTDTCRSEGMKEAVARVNIAADAGADLGLIFPRNTDEM